MHLGAIAALLAGLIVGTAAWPVKVMKKLEFEQWWFVGMMVALVIIPWTSALASYHKAFAAYSQVPAIVLLKSNLFALGWGIANVLYGICITRMGVALSTAILSGLGVCTGVTLPMLMKGSGLFANAPDLISKAGFVILGGVGVMLAGVVLAALAGSERDKVLAKAEKRSGKFMVNLVMCVIAGVLSCGLSLAFVYSQGPVVEAMKARGAGDITANLAVWSGGVMSGAIVNILYPVVMMTRKRTWGLLVEGWKEIGLAAATGVHLLVGVALMGRGMVLLGALGASVGFGIQQAVQLISSQGLGYVSGEWRGVYGKPRMMMLFGITILLAAAAVMAYGNTLGAG